MSDSVELQRDGHGAVLVGDIGGTRARFGVVDSAGRLNAVRILRASDYPNLVEAASDYLGGLELEERPRLGSIAVACPILDDRVSMTNHPWRFSIAETRAALELDTLEVLNDFIALALALPVLGEERTREIKSGDKQVRAPIGLLGPGTGLGVSALVPVAQGWVALPTEGGHRDFAASTDREWEISKLLGRRFGHVSAERVLSGPGLVNLYLAICEIDGVGSQEREPAEVVASAVSGTCPVSQEAVRIFARQLGSVAGDLALTLGARGGMFIGGGVVESMETAFDAELFREGFLAKGRFRSYLEAIPVRLVLSRTAALLGAARALEYDFPAGVRASAAG